VYTTTEIDALIVCFRQELEQINRDIVALERQARVRHAGTIGELDITRDLTPLTRTGRGWSHHHRRTEQ
jgi:hypothetical protein